MLVHVKFIKVVNILKSALSRSKGNAIEAVKLCTIFKNNICYLVDADEPHPIVMCQPPKACQSIGKLEIGI